MSIYSPACSIQHLCSVRRIIQCPVPILPCRDVQPLSPSELRISAPPESPIKKPLNNRCNFGLALVWLRLFFFFAFLWTVLVRWPGFLLFFFPCFVLFCFSLSLSPSLSLSCLVTASELTILIPRWPIFIRAPGRSRSLFRFSLFCLFSFFFFFFLVHAPLQSDAIHLCDEVRKERKHPQRKETAKHRRLCRLTPTALSTSRTGCRIFCRLSVSHQSIVCGAFLSVE